MKKWMLYLYLSLSLPCLIWAQQSALFSDAAAVALGRAVAASPRESWWAGNPAAGVGEVSGVLAMQTAMPYGLPEWTVSGLAVAKAVGTGRWTLAMQTYGLAPEQRYLGLMAGYGRQLNERWALGVQLASLQEWVQGYGVRAGLAVKAGLQWQLSEGWRFGCIWQPYVGSDFGAAGLSLGVERSFEAHLRLLLDLQQTADAALPSWRMGLEYAPIPALQLRLGLSLQRGLTGFLRVYAGAGYAFAHWQLDVATEFHPYLGFTPFLNLQRQISKRSGLGGASRLNH
ncbi:MAG TPA: hypothetical protein ENJ88_04810 [Phaeodactylibacter sp.]|nr:hypothetical protein [Phaeodactylibacter sp.]